MTTQGRCERCMNYDKHLKEVNGRMLCRECRDEQESVSKPEIPYKKVRNPFTRILKEWKRVIRKKKSSKEEKIKRR